MLVLPTSHVLDVGTGQPMKDARAWIASEEKNLLPLAASNGEDWQPIEGEILTFSDDAARLSRLDHLELFHPGEESLYHRVLALTNSAPPQLTWVYVAPDGKLPPESQRMGPRWP